MEKIQGGLGYTQEERPVSFGDWTRGRRLQSIGTNAGAEALPFQSWRHFKEAFAPELIQRAITESPIPVAACLDPFGGSGTTALGCQFLGVRPVTVEVNPYLADLIEAKLSIYDVDEIARDFSTLVRNANKQRLKPQRFYSSAPPTFVEPGINGRWLFDARVAARMAAYVAALPSVRRIANRRLFRVLLGGVLINASNVVVSGKGRRYRRHWEQRELTGADLDEAFCQAVESAVRDVLQYGTRAEQRYTVLCGDARKLLAEQKPVDLCVFSPPYPNSFDYTDVYNVELWGLRYLTQSADNTRLRLATLASHVQIKRHFSPPPAGSVLLDRTIKRLRSREKNLWDRRIPDMVGNYFFDLSKVIRGVRALLQKGGQIWIVVGDSKYVGVRIDVAEIISQLAPNLRCKVVTQEPFRSMRSSIQQGGSHNLNETLLILGRS
jgi:DNA modification methylase